MVGLTSTMKFVLHHPGGGIPGLIRFLKWQTLTRVLRDPILVVPWIKGASLAIRRGEHGLTGNLYCTLLEFDEMGFFLSTHQEGDTFIDVGANGGSYTVLASAARGSRVLAFEPVPETYETLVRNVQVNEVQRLVTTHSEALADYEGFGTMRVPDSPTAFLSSEDSTSTPLAATPVTTLDQQVALDGPTFLKIDVEGGELGVIRGAREVLSDPRLLAASVEISWSGDSLSDASTQVVDGMQEVGFECFSFDYQRAVLSAGLDPGQRNALFISDIEAIRRRLKLAQGVAQLAHGKWKILRNDQGRRA